MRLHGIVFGKAYISLEEKENEKEVFDDLKKKTEGAVKEMILTKDFNEAINLMGDEANTHD